MEAKYYNWLSYLSSNLSGTPTNSSVNQGARSYDYDYDRYITQMGRIGYYNVIDLYVKWNNTTMAAPLYYCFQHDTASAAVVKQVHDNSGAWDATPGTAAYYILLGTYAIPLPTSNAVAINPRDDCATYPTQADAAYDFSRELNSNKASFVINQIRTYDTQSSTLQTPVSQLSSAAGS